MSGLNYENASSRVEIKSIDPKSTVKVMMYMLLPLVAIWVVFAILAVLGGALFGAFTGTQSVVFSLAVLAGFLGMLMFVVLSVVISGYIIAWIYNLCAARFGGLMMTLKSETTASKTLDIRSESDGSRHV